MKIVEAAEGEITFDGARFKSFEMLPGVRRVEKVAVVNALQMQHAFELVHLNGRIETGNQGDWILQAGKHDIYVVKDGRFRTLYRIV
jgi:hypothetical protein